MSMKISLITVTYNSGATLADTLTSVLAQTYRNIEYIIVDGASKDDTITIIRSYQERFSGRLTYISEPDRGLYDAMNKGIMMATGEVVGILNSDDFFSSPDILERIVGAFSAEIDAVYGDIHYVAPVNLQRCVRYYSSAFFKRWHIRFGLIPAHPSFYVRRSLFLKYGLYNIDYRIAGDFDLFLRFIFINRIKTEYIPMDFVTMRTQGVSTSSWKVHLTIMKEHLKIFRLNHVYTNILFLSFRYLYKIYTLLKLKHYLQGTDCP